MNNIPEIVGVIKKIIFNKDEFYIFQLETTDETFTALGELYQVVAGDEIAVWGKWISHPKYGRQLKLDGFRKKIPTSIEAIEEYLASDLVKGIGPKTAKKIVKLYGEDSLEICQNHPDKLIMIKGITQKKAEEISDCLKQALEFQKIMLELLPLGLTVKTVIKIYQQFGGNTIIKLAENPYILTSVPQIGFVKADSIARKLDIPFDSVHRIKAGIEYVLLEEANQNGHLYLEKDVLVNKAKELLEDEGQTIIDEQLGAALNLLEVEGKIVIEDDRFVYWSIFNFWEREAALSVSHMLTGLSDKFFEEDLLQCISEYQENYGIKLAEKQKNAIQKACIQRLSIITGGPGTGKTQTVKAIIDIWQKLRKDKKIVLAAPTGRAARRMKEITGQEAVTIHRLLKLGKSESYLDFDEGDHVKADLLVIDEFSMVDMHLFYQLMSSVDDDTSLVFIGDTDQLPSVGPGNVLSELISAGVPAIRLTEIFRQENQSQIVINAHRCNKGESLQFYHDSNDFFFIYEEDNQRVVKRIIQAVERLVTKGMSVEEIQVLSPMKKTETGIENLNKVLQEVLNPNHPLKGSLINKSATFRVGDKVMQTVNNYEKEVFNGDIGIIYQVEKSDQENQWLEVIFDERKVKYTVDELEELTLAYAITVHKSQGSEYKAIIMPVTTQHFIMLARNLIYTGITRAREKVVMLGTTKALNIAIRNNKVLQRNSRLASRIN